MTQNTGPDGEVVAGYAYDSNHHVLRATNAVGEVTYFSYDAKGLLTSVTTPSGLVRTNVYFTSGADINRLSKTYEYSGSEYYRSNAFTYADGLVSTRTDERGVTTTSYWDGLRRLTGISYPDGSSISNLIDQGTPVPLRRHLSGHTVSTAFELGPSNLSNGDLLAKAESQFDLMLTTDQNLGYQQNLIGQKLAILVLPTTSVPATILPQVRQVIDVQK
jgi:YD repeat-containing protein